MKVVKKEESVADVVVTVAVAVDLAVMQVVLVEHQSVVYLVHKNVLLQDKCERRVNEQNKGLMI
jgi:hypothetical protein